MKQKKYLICIFTDGRNKVCTTNSLVELLEWYADNKIDGVTL